MRVVIALGGNALLRRGEPLTAEKQRRNVKVAAEALAPIAREQWQIRTSIWVFILHKFKHSVKNEDPGGLWTPAVCAGGL